MKHLHVIALMFLALMVACTPSAQVVEPAEGSSEELSAIDSLMWRKPDSALAQLQQFVVSHEADSLDEFNGHYCQLLISELLYKNYKPQSNRDKLLRAVDYFDSLCGRTDVARNVSTVFLDARAHYINGAGYYEKDSVVNACAEYLKTLEVMEEKLDKKSPKGKDAVFMFYTYNRLLSLFSTQFMMDPAIFCCEQALACCQNEPSLSKEIPNTYYHMGKQYDKKGEKDIARYYYGMTIEGLSDINNPVYRDAMSTKALCDYQVGLGVDFPLTTIRQMLSHANSKKEKLTRYFTIGVIFTIEQSIDSALFYLEPIFENKDNISLQTQAAEYLLINYDNTENKEKAEECMRFLSDHKESEGENKALTSKLEAMFKNYQDQKQKEEAEEMREKSIRKTVEIIVPIAIMVALTVFIVMKLRSKKRLKQQKEETDKALGKAEQEHEKELRLWQAVADKTLEETKKKYEEELGLLKAETERQMEEVERKHQHWRAEAKERHEEELRVQKDLSEKEIEETKKRHASELEAERLAYQKEREALRQSLRQREAQVNALETALTRQRKEAEQRREAFLKEPICQRILGQVHRKTITTRENAFELGLSLKDEDFEQLGTAVEKHYEGFDNMLLSQCPSLKQGLISLCHLHLLGINESEIAVLKNVSYSAIKKQNESLQEKLGVEEDVASYIMRVIEGLCGTQNIDQNVSKNKLLQQNTEEIPQESTLKSTLKSTQKTIVEIIIGNPNVTILEVADELDLNPRGIAKHFKTLQDKGIIRRVGPDKGGHWEVIR